MPLHTWYGQGPRRPSSCTSLSLNPHWGRTATSKKSLVAMRAGLLWYCLTLRSPVGCGLPGFSVGREGSPGKNTGMYWPILVAIPFLSSIFPASLASDSPEDMALPEPCNPSSCTTSRPGPHRGKPQSSRATSGANPSGRPTCKGGNKATIETQEWRG